MNISSSEIIEWAEARDIQFALSSISDSIDVHQTIVNDRVDLVRTAIGVALIEGYEDASSVAELAKQSLETMGIFPDTNKTDHLPEFVVDRPISRSEFGWIARGVFNEATSVDERLWNTLRRHATGIFTTKANEKSIAYELSLKGLRELVEAEDLGNFTNVGTSSIDLAKAVVDYFSFPQPFVEKVSSIEL